VRLGRDVETGAPSNRIVNGFALLLIRKAIVDIYLFGSLFFIVYLLEYRNTGLASLLSRYYDAAGDSLLKYVPWLFVCVAIIGPELIDQGIRVLGIEELGLIVWMENQLTGMVNAILVYLLLKLSIFLAIGATLFTLGPAIRKNEVSHSHSRL